MKPPVPVAAFIGLLVVCTILGAGGALPFLPSGKTSLEISAVDADDPLRTDPGRPMPNGLPEVEEPKPSPLPLPGTMTSEEYQALLYKFLQDREYIALGWSRDKGVRDTGPFIDNTSYGTHNAVRIWYSPEVIAWLENGRAGSIPDGAIIVKEMFKPPAARYDSLTGARLDSAVDSWAVMVRDSAASKDGWYWSFYMPGQAVDDPDKYPFDYPNSGFGQYCVRCHASAENEFTFSSLTNVEGYPGDPLTFRVDNSWIPGYTNLLSAGDARRARMEDSLRALLTDAFNQAGTHGALASAAVPGGSLSDTTIHARELNADFAELFDQMPVIPAHDVARLPSVAYDHVYVGPGGPEQFVTSDQCLSCHDGQGLPFGPNMYIPSSDGKNINLSPYGEWNWSMMGLSGRDPIFYAQLESEMRLYPTMSDTIQNLCFSCHGVMGQRQMTIDHPGSLFNESIPYVSSYSDPNYRYGALARDGVSCTVCHQIVDDGLPLDSIYTGRFHVSTPGEFQPGVSYIYGPFEDPRVLAMESSLGMKPVQSDYIKSSRLCGSCHTVHLPVLDTKGEQIGTVFEQATYLEWQNSNFQNEFGSGGKTPKTCQNCHMPDRYPFSEDGTKLAFRIANIQDQTYPQADSRAPLDSITLDIRQDYVRHSLLGINVFALQMFNQFPDILGIRKQDYMTGSKNGLPFAIETAGQLAQQHTAQVAVQEVKLDDRGLKATVKVTNLTGHRLPSGVGFRRAFLEFQVIDRSNTVIWASGRTNSVGAIVDGQGRILPSEFLEFDPKADTQYYQPHYQTITRQDQAQIYQELSKNSAGVFTTSFLGIAKHVKDNRLLPDGWTKSGPPGFKYAEATMPFGNALKDPDFTNGTGSDVIVYQVNLPRAQLEGATVVATLYYQSIPPYYLRDRFTIGKDGRGTQRLHYMTSRLQTQGTLIENWKLKVASGWKVAGK